MGCPCVPSRVAIVNSRIAAGWGGSGCDKPSGYFAWLIAWVGDLVASVDDFLRKVRFLDHAGGEPCGWQYLVPGPGWAGDRQIHPRSRWCLSAISQGKPQRNDSERVNAFA